VLITFLPTVNNMLFHLLTVLIPTINTINFEIKLDQFRSS